MKRNLVRSAVRFLAPSVFCFAVIGCGGSSTTSNSPNSASPQVAQDSTTPPTDVVSQFLDQVRRGGEDSGAGQLLTQMAQSELRRIGRTVQPLGTPAASFEVTRSEAVPNDPNSILVHSIWREPNPEGESAQFEVVWGLQREEAGWRISGLAVENGPGAEPDIINFEDGRQLQQIFGDPSSQAAAPSEEIAR